MEPDEMSEAEQGDRGPDADAEGAPRQEDGEPAIAYEYEAPTDWRHHEPPDTDTEEEPQQEENVSPKDPEDEALEVQEMDLPPGVDEEGVYKRADKAQERLFKCLQSFPKPPARPPSDVLKELKNQLKIAQGEAERARSELSNVVSHLRDAAGRCKSKLNDMVRRKQSLQVPGTKTLYSEAVIKQQQVYDSVLYSLDACECMVKTLDGLLEKSRYPDYTR
jgi:hypothetical protein